MIPFSSQKVLLKDGRQALIKAFALDDIPSLFEMEKAVLLDGRGVVRHPDEFPSTVEEYAGGQMHWWQQKRAIQIVCKVDKTVAGCGELSCYKPRYLQHIGSIEMGVHPHFQGLGIGKHLLHSLISIAKNAKETTEVAITRVQLNVLANNHRAINLYRSVGFQLEGTRRQFLQTPNGNLIDDHTMALLF